MHVYVPSYKYGTISDTVAINDIIILLPSVSLIRNSCGNMLHTVCKFCKVTMGMFSQYSTKEAVLKGPQNDSIIYIDQLPALLKATPCGNTQNRSIC